MHQKSSVADNLFPIISRINYLQKSCHQEKAYLDTIKTLIYCFFLRHLSYIAIHLLPRVNVVTTWWKICIKTIQGNVKRDQENKIMHSIIRKLEISRTRISTKYRKSYSRVKS